MEYLSTISITMSTFIISTASVYALYYFYKVVHRPCLIAADGDFKSMLQTNLHSLKEHSWPTFWAFNPHFQTICRVVMKSKPVIAYRREILTTEDGGHIAIDWVDNDVDNTKYPNHKTRPIVVIMPGITGSSNESYVRHIAYKSIRLGYRVIVFNNRGLGGISLKTPRAYCACNCEDLSFVLNHVTELHPDTPIVMFAVSLGGMLLCHFFLQCGKNINKQIKGGMVVSVPFDSESSMTSLEKTSNLYLYNKRITKALNNIVKRNLKVFEENRSKLPFNLEKVLKASTIREFDEHFTSRSFGYEGSKAYYKATCLSSKSLGQIKVPLLFLNSKDDPFSPEEFIPLANIQKNPNLAIILTDYGGHVGFIEGLMIRDRSIVERIFVDYASSLLNQNIK